MYIYIYIYIPPQPDLDLASVEHGLINIISLMTSRRTSREVIERVAVFVAHR